MATEKYALITGGATGVGFSIAKELAKKGYSLIIVGNIEEDNKYATQYLQQNFSTTTRYFTIDLATNEAALQLFNFCDNENMNVEVLVNNAGMFFFDAVVSENIERTHKMLNLHVTTATLLCALFGQKMKINRQGYILNISSICAWMPFPGIAIYAASKRYIKNFSRSLAYELCDFGVKVSTITPGAVDTDLYQLNEKTRKRLNRWGIMISPDKIARKATNALFKGKVTVIPGVMNRLVIFIVALAPHRCVNLIKRKLKLKPFVIN